MISMRKSVFDVKWNSLHVQQRTHLLPCLSGIITVDSLWNRRMGLHI